MRFHLRSTLLALCSTMLLGALAAPMASAHVTANTSAPPTKGGYAKVDFRVPTERDDPTTAVTVQMPDGTLSVGVQPVPGWTYAVKKRTLDTPIKGEDGDITEVVDTVTWSGGEIRAGEFQQFPISIKLPEKGELGDLLFFPATQTYADGTVVKWNAKPASATDSGELEHPAPKLTLVAAAAGGGHGAPAAVKAAAAPAAAVVDQDDSSTSGMIAMVLSALALLLALGAFMRSGRRSE